MARPNDNCDSWPLHSCHTPPWIAPYELPRDRRRQQKEDLAAALLQLPIDAFQAVLTTEQLLSGADVATGHNMSGISNLTYPRPRCSAM